MEKQGYLSPALGVLEISLVRDARPTVSILLDLGIPNFTVFSLKFPFIEEEPKSTNALLAEAVHILLDEMSAFMMSLDFDQSCIITMYATILDCFKNMTAESDTDASNSPASEDNCVKTFEGTFKLPMVFVDETYEKVVTAATKIQRTPAVRHLQLNYSKPVKPTVSDAQRIIRQYQQRSLKTQPQPLYVVVYDHMGRPRGTIQYDNNFKNKLLNSIYNKKAAKTPEYTPTVKFITEIDMKLTNVDGIPKNLVVGETQFDPTAYCGNDMALYEGGNAYIVKLPDGRCVGFPSRPTVLFLKANNFPVPGEYGRWRLLNEEEEKPSEDAVDSVGVEINETDPEFDMGKQSSTDEEEEDNPTCLCRHPFYDHNPCAGCDLCDCPGFDPLNLPEEKNQGKIAWVEDDDEDDEDNGSLGSLYGKPLESPGRVKPLTPEEDAECDELMYRYRQDPDSVSQEEYERYCELSNRANEAMKHKEQEGEKCPCGNVLQDSEKAIGLCYSCCEGVDPRTRNKVPSGYCMGCLGSDHVEPYVCPKCGEDCCQHVWRTHAPLCEAAPPSKEDEDFTKFMKSIGASKKQGSGSAKEHVKTASFTIPSDEVIDFLENNKHYQINCSCGNKLNCRCRDCDQKVLNVNQGCSGCQERVKTAASGYGFKKEKPENPYLPQLENVLDKFPDKRFNGYTPIGDVDYMVSCPSLEPPVVLIRLSKTADPHSVWGVWHRGRRITFGSDATSLLIWMNENVADKVPDVKSKPEDEPKQYNAKPATASVKNADRIENGFWVGEGSGASGILPICSSTGRICLAWRSSEVMEGDCYGTLGGAIQRGMTPEESAKQEMAEESGYSAAITLHPAFVFKSGSFSYFNFLGVVPTEFGFQPHGDASWETDGISWHSFEEVQEMMRMESGLFHRGLIALFKNSGKEIQRLCSQSSNKKQERPK